jgi:uncharacterized protein (TIGR03437 family)
MRVRLVQVMVVAALMPWLAAAATFGTVVQVHGAVADIALDEKDGLLFAANFSAYRVEVINIAGRTLVTNIPVTAPPSAVAVSPDNHYLVIGLYQTPNSSVLGGFQPDTGGIDIFDLTAGGITQRISLPSPVLGVAFGGDGNALVITRTPTSGAPNILLLNPATGSLTPIATITMLSRLLPQNPTDGESNLLVTAAPAQIIQTAMAVSADKSTIHVLGAVKSDDSATSPDSVSLRYDVASHSINTLFLESTPPMGPRSVATDATGVNVVRGWTLDKYVANATCLADPTSNTAYGPGPCSWAQFPAVNGAFHLGSHAWDVQRNLIYSQMPAPNDGPVLHILDTDNLTVRERLQIPENLSGTSLMSSDANTMFSTSVSGVTIFPIGQLPQTPRLAAAQEDLLFADTGNGCTASLWTQTLTINSLGSAAADFTLSLPTGVTGVTLSKTTGTTPAQVNVTIDPIAFQNAKGTTSLALTITSNAGVNLPPAVRLLINLRGATQVGRIFNVPGKIVDMLPDPSRSRLYLLRQDKNQVQVFDMATLTLLGTLRTGNTPTHMAMTLDNQFLVVGNDNSMIANVLDLNALAPSAPILFPYGHYPRSIGFTYTESFALARNAGLMVPIKGDVPTATLDVIDFANRVAFTPETLDGTTNPAINSNNLPVADGVIAPSGDGLYLTLELSDSTVAEYDATADTWVASRKGFGGLAGSYAALSDNLWVAGPNLLDAALVPVGTAFPLSDGTSSGAAPYLGIGLRSSSTAATDPGLLNLINTSTLGEFDPTLMAEAPVTLSSQSTPPVGQIGESILSFTRSLAVSPDQSTIYAGTISGLTILPGTFYVPPNRPSISSVVSTADQASPAATGGLITIHGSNLSGSSQGSGFPLATSLGSACFTVNGELLPLYYVSPGMVNAQVPYDIVGGAAITVRSPAGVSDPFSLQVQAVAPAVFLNTTANPGSSIPFITRVANGLLVTPSNPVHRGDTLQIYLTGMGQTTPPATAGVAAPGTPVESVNVPPVVTIGGANATVTSANLTPGEAGVYQVQVSVPMNAPIGLSLPLTISQGGSSQTSQVRVVP